ncbi:MAG: class I SAM-dependent methyltransferase [Candidatus Binatus sp.]|nr:class I SAM-dependent methyltransferase [Candidatus Binatus sp.]MDO8432381.1 class I SAM-dependent methyltransferase [Candidatus Binatus sp.]
MQVDEKKLQEMIGKMLGDVGAAMGAALVLLGDKLGLYKTLASAGPLSSAELASRTGTAERYVREWAAGQAAAGYINYDPASARYSMSPEQALLLADENGPAFFPAMYEIAAAAVRDEPKVADAFRSGGGVGWHEHDACLFRGTERFFRPSYAAHLVSEWIPALEGVKEKLERGATVADVGCGHGASLILMAQAFPKSQFCGFDYHEPSILAARERAREAEVADRVKFERASAKDFPGSYDLVAFFDCLHDMGDPVGAGAHVKQALKPGGTWMVVEPFAGDRTEDNFNPIGRIFYAASTTICVPGSLSQEVGLGLGAQAGEARIREVLNAGGFSRVRLATATPFNLILEARP